MARRYVNPKAEMTIPTEHAELEALLDDTDAMTRVFEDKDLTKQFMRNMGRAQFENEQHELFTRLRNEGGARGPGGFDPGRHLANGGGGDAAAPFFTGHPLAVDAASLTAMDEALRERRTHRVQISNAALTTTTLGQPAGWGENQMPGPRMLHMLAGVPQQTVDATLAEHAKFGLPTAAAGVAEGVTLGEYDSSTAGSVTLERFGRFTDLTKESRIGASAAGITSMHRLAIAKDLDQALVEAVETAAGTPATFDADVPAAIRKAIATVIDATAAADARDLVILAHPDDVALLEDVTPIGGDSVGQGFQRFSGALTYPTSYITSGIAVVANLKVGCRYFTAAGLAVETDTDVKTGVTTYASSVISGYGTDLIGGFAEAVDVVTP